MPSVAWKLARAASRAAAAAAGSSRASAAAAARSAAAAAAARSAAAVARSHGGSDAVKHPPSRYHLVGDPSSAAPRPPIPSEFNHEEAYLPSYERYSHGRTFPTNSRRWRPVGCLFNSDMRSDKKAMPFEKKDLESEETLWALYNQWLSYFNVARYNDEKRYRFKIFKERVRLIYELCGADPNDLKANHLSDVDVDELCPPKRFLHR